MNARRTDPAHAAQPSPAAAARKDLLVAVLLAQLLERLERGRSSLDAAQYRSVVRHLGVELQRLPRDAALDALLSASPAAAAVYENLHYAHAGLCRSPLDAAAQAELLARELIARAGRGPVRGPQAG